MSSIFARFLLSFIFLSSTFILSASALVSVGKTKNPPVLDGKEDLCYRQALPITNFVQPISLEYAKDVTILKLIRDEKFLYGFADCRQKNMKMIPKSSHLRDDASLWKTNSIELFFEDGNELKQIILNSEGGIFDAKYQPDEAQKYRIDRSFNCDVAAMALRHDNGFFIEFRIPLAQLPKPPFRFNVIRNNAVSKEHSTFAPLEQQNWHRVEDYARIAFRDTVPGFDFICPPESGSGKKLELKAYTPIDFFLNGKKFPLSAGKNIIAMDSGKKIVCDVKDGDSVLYSWSHQLPGRYIRVTPTASPLYLDNAKIYDAHLPWKSSHNFPGGAAPSQGGRIKINYQIVFDLPPGITLLEGREDPATPGRFIQEEEYAYNARNWISSHFRTTLPEKTKGQIKYFIQWKGGRTETSSFPFEVVRITPTSPPKKFLTGYYNGWVKNLQHARVFRAMGINMIPVRGYSESAVKLAQQLKKDGFFVQRGSYFWPGSTVNAGGKGYLKWTEKDRSARSRDIGGFYIPVDNSYQISPSYRGRYYVEAIEKEIQFCRKAGINYFSFDLENYIQPKGELGDFHERTVKLFRQYWEKTYPGKRYIAPQVFERTPVKYPEYHSAWVDFKCSIWADFFVEMKKRIQKGLQGKVSSPYPGVIFTDWNIGRIWQDANRNKMMRNASWFKAFDIIELDNYSSLDKDLRIINLHLEKMEETYPEVDFKWILTPSPRRLDIMYYKTTARPVANELKYAVMEAAGYGAKGVIIWYLPLADVETMKQFADGITIIKRCEEIVLNGKRVKNISCNYPKDLVVEDYFFGRKSIWRNQDRVFVKALEYAEKTLICVSEYREQKPMEVIVNYCPKQNVTIRDLELDKIIGRIPAGAKSFRVSLETARRCKLLLLEPDESEK